MKLTWSAKRKLPRPLQLTPVFDGRREREQVVKGRMALLRNLVVGACLMLDGQAMVAADERAVGTEKPGGQCEAESIARFGRSVIASVEVPPQAPRRTRFVEPKLPQRELGRGSGEWRAEVLIDPKGKVRRVWLADNPQLERLWPEFKNAIPDAIMQWRYEPVKVGGRATPICVHVVTRIDLR